MVYLACVSDWSLIPQKKTREPTTKWKASLGNVVAKRSSEYHLPPVARTIIVLVGDPDGISQLHHPSPWRYLLMLARRSSYRMTRPTVEGKGGLGHPANVINVAQESIRWEQYSLSRLVVYGQERIYGSFCGSNADPLSKMVAPLRTMVWSLRYDGLAFWPDP